ncbi:acyltransferase family protein [Blastochloris sulfoviridis]|uniref:acyltransferase family protein n=1 Tax=Blastochloris sulfoviridis TaxID=50712 RepID=UPI001478DBCE|nr:acyltransferase family protein [Blastochloris sulfoviridis]
MPQPIMVSRQSGRDFRRDIQGLRAIAVLAILVFHLSDSWLPGGFAGVDIFFVISGYLISRQIIQAESFSFRTFYLRRFRRLFAALLATVLVSLLVGWKILTPADYVSLGWSALYSLLATANIHFYLSQNYFDSDVFLKPLLHIWSLSVEEQFYLFWPAAIVALKWLRLPLVPAIVAVGVMSLAASYWVTGIAPSFAFYMMPFRVFEFSLGAAVVLLGDIRCSAWLRQACGAGGLVLITISLLVFDGRTPWPGLAALVPTLGTAALIFAGPASFANRLLDNAIFQFVGRRSYSIYLVHWPLIVFYRYWMLLPVTPAELVSLFAGSIVLGAVLFSAVEKPFRYGFSQTAKLRSWRAAGTAATGLAAVCALAGSVGLAVAVVVADGFPARVKSVQKPGELTFAGDLCDHRLSRCGFGDLSANRIVYLVGDSHALNLLFGLDELFKEHGFKGIAFFDHGCLFLRNTRRFISGVPDQQCAKNVAQAYRQLEADKFPVILVGNYGGYARDIGESDGPLFEGVGNDYVNWLEERLSKSLRQIRAGERTTILLNSSYNAGINIATCLARPGGDLKSCQPAPLAKVRKETEAIDLMVERVSAQIPGLMIIDPKSVFCSNDQCEIMAGNQLYFRDATHLTNAGSRFLISRIQDRLLAALNGSPAHAPSTD